MRRSRSPLPIALLALALLPLGAAGARAAAPTAASPPPPRLFGAWAINQQLTAELAEHARADGRRGDDMHGGHHGGHGSSGEGGPHAGGRPEGWSGAEDRGDGRPPLAGLIFTAASDGAVLLTDDTGRARRFEPGAPARHAEQESAEVGAHWDADGDLVVEIKPDRGPRRTETYIVDHEKKHLYVTTVVASGFGSRSRTLAFDPVDPATLPPPGTGSPGR